MSTSDLNSEVRAIRYAIQGLRKQVSDICREGFPGNLPGPQKWIDLIIGLLDTAQLRLNEIPSAASNPDKTQLLRQAAQCTGEAYQYLTFCQGIGAGEIPHPVAVPLERLVHSLDFENDFFFRAKLEANYELCPFDNLRFSGVRNPAPSLTEAINRIHWPFQRITVPSRAFSILPHFAIVGHEIGHALVRRVDWQHIFDPSQDSNLIDQIMLRLTGIVNRGGKFSFSEDGVRRITSQVFTNWFSEIAADAIGFYLMGPALFFALQEFLLIASTGTYGLWTTHPANELRLRFLHKRLHERFGNSGKSYADIFRMHTDKELAPDFNNATITKTPPTDELFRHLLNTYDKSGSVVLSAVVAELNEKMDRCDDAIYSSAREFFQSNYKNLLYTPDQYEEDLNQFLEGMLYAVPPIESPVGPGQPPKPIEFASIINVGWVVLLCKLDKFTLGDLTSDQRVETLQGLILKGVELSEARRLWNKPR